MPNTIQSIWGGGEGFEEDNIIMPICQMRKQRLREVTYKRSQANKLQGQGSSPALFVWKSSTLNHYTVQ